VNCNLEMHFLTLSYHQLNTPCEWSFIKKIIYSLMLFFHLSNIEYHECSYVTSQLEK
jgi:hypothetical protein